MAKEKITEFQRLTANIYENMNNIFRNDEDKSPITLKNEELNETFFTAELFALQLQFNMLTNQDLDIVDFIGVLNKLAFQHLLEEGAENE
jgi:hypothetical protein